ncbi:hypothetical protein SLA2020_303090 [Shorea laevis]
MQQCVGFPSRAKSLNPEWEALLMELLLLELDLDLPELLLLGTEELQGVGIVDRRERGSALVHTGGSMAIHAAIVEKRVEF